MGPTITGQEIKQVFSKNNQMFNPILTVIMNLIILLLQTFC